VPPTHQMSANINECSKTAFLTLSFEQNRLKCQGHINNWKYIDGAPLSVRVCSAVFLARALFNLCH